MYKNILVPLDGSPFAEQALPLALSIASRARAALHLVLVHAPVAVPYNGTELIYDTGLDETLREREVVYLDALVKRWSAVGPRSVRREIVDGAAAAEMIRAQAEATLADLVVMTTHGRGPLSRLWLGSVADRILRHPPARVLLVRPRETAPEQERGAVKHILIPLDGTEFAEQMIEPSIALGSLTSAEYTLVRVIGPIPQFAARYAGHAVIDYGETLERRLQEEQKSSCAAAVAYLERVAEPLRARSLSVQTRVITHDQPPAAVLELGSSIGADLIALRSHGRHGISRMFLGSFADKIVRGASTPVLL